MRPASDIEDDKQDRRRARVRRYFLRACLGTLVTFGAVLLFVCTADLGVFKPQIERFVSAEVARPFRIGGDLEVRLGRRAVAIAHDVTLGNAVWAGDDPLIEADRIEIRVDLLSLLRGPLIVDLVELDDATLRLETNDAGEANWALGEARPPDPEPAGTDDGFRVRHVSVERLQILYDSPGRETPLVVDLHSIEQTQQADDMLGIVIAGAVGERAAGLRGRVGPWGALLASRNIRFEMEGELHTLSLEARGLIDDLLRPHRPTLSFAARGPDINDVTRLFHLAEEARGDINLHGTLAPVGHGPLALDVNGNFGEAEIEARGSFSDLQSLDAVDLELRATAPNLGRVFRWFGIERVREAPFSIEIDARRQGPMLDIGRAVMNFGASELDFTARVPQFPRLDSANIDLMLSGPDIEDLRHLLRLPGAATGPFSLDATITSTPGGEEVSLEAVTSLARATLDGTLGPAPDFHGSRLRFSLEGDDAARLAGEWIPRMPAATFEVGGRVELTDGGVRSEEPLVVKLGDASARVEGLVTHAPNLLGSEIAFEMSGPDSSRLLQVFRAGGAWPARPYSARGHWRAEQDGLRLVDLDATIGSIVVAGDGLLVLAPGITGSRFRFQARGPAIEEALPSVEGARTPRGAFDARGAIAFATNAISLDDAHLELDHLRLTGALRLDRRASDRRIGFDVQGAGDDVRVLLQHIERFDASPAPFSFSARGRLDGMRLTLDRSQAGVGGARATAAGTLDLDPAAHQGTRFEFEGGIPDLAALGTFDGRSFAKQQLDWALTITAGDGLLEARELSVRIGASEIGGNATYRRSEPPALTLNLESDGVVLEPLFAREPDKPVATPRFEGGRIVPDIELPFDAMQKLDAAVDLRFAKFQRGALTLQDVVLEAELLDGAFDLVRLSFKAPAGQLGARMSIRPPGNGAGSVRLDLILRDFAVGLSPTNRGLSGRTDLDLAVEATGADLRTLAENLDGAVLLRMNNHRMNNNRFLGFLYGDVLDGVLSVINPLAKTDAYTDIECAVLPWQITDGQLADAPHGFVRTAHVNIATQTRVNLASEALDITVRTTPTSSWMPSAGELLNPYIKIGGTLAEPRLMTDTSGALISGGAAAATGGLSIVGKSLWDRLSRSGDPCGDLAAEAKASLAGRLPDPAELSLERLPAAN